MEDGVATLGLQAELPLGEAVELQALVVRGQDRGWLTFAEIAGCLEEVEVTKEQVSALHAQLLEQGVDVVSEDGRPVPPSPDEPRRESANGDGPATRSRRKPDLDLTVEPSLDCLRLYLRAIGEVELLSAGRSGRSPGASSAATCAPRST